MALKITRVNNLPAAMRLTLLLTFALPKLPALQNKTVGKPKSSCKIGGEPLVAASAPHIAT